MNIFLVFFVGMATAFTCSGAALGTPCLCTFGALTGTETVCPGPTFGGSGVIIAGGFCQTTGFSCQPVNCCHECGSGAVNSAIGEQCDPGAFAVGDCCLNTCLFSAASTACSDGNSCTTGADEVCTNAGVCTSGTTTLDCDDSLACTQDSCNPISGCVNTDLPMNTPCADSDPCNGDELCDNTGNCNAGTALACVDSHPCTQDGICVPNVGCDFTQPHPSCGGATMDPHVFGPNGEKFLFVGKEGHNYTFFSTPQFTVNVQLRKAKGSWRGLYIVQAGVMFANVSMTFDAVNPMPLRVVNAIVSTAGARATGDDRNILFELCPGQTISIATKTNYLNIFLTVPGCHDSSRGIVGQMYQCKYGQHKKFVWNATAEETFAVNSLTSDDTLERCSKD